MEDTVKALEEKVALLEAKLGKKSNIFSPGLPTNKASRML